MNNRPFRRSRGRNWGIWKVEEEKKEDKINIKMKNKKKERIEKEKYRKKWIICHLKVDIKGKQRKNKKV